MLRGVARQTSFRFTVIADPAVAEVLARHAGAARFAYNQCLAEVKTALDQRQTDPTVRVPWTGFSLINHFNAWKRSPQAGRTWAVDPAGQVSLVDVGLPWRGQVCAQVFEEAAVDLGRGLAAFAESRTGRRSGPRVRFPRFKRKGRARESFRLRNKLSRTGVASIRIGTPQHPRAVVLPGIGMVPVVEDTRRLRRLLRPDENGQPRARIWFATISAHRGRWVITVNVQAPDLHPGMRHPDRRADDGGFVGVDRGLNALVVAATATGHEVARIHAPKPLATALPKLRQAARAVSRKRPGSRNRVKATGRLARLHARVADRRAWFTHQVSTTLVKTHDRLCVETLTVANLIRHRQLSRAIADAAWGQLHQQLAYKAGWYGTTLTVAPRFFPSTKTCSRCGQVHQLSLGDRTLHCKVTQGGCGLVIDRDRNAAVNLAVWAEAEHAAHAQTPDLQAAGRDTNACGGAGAGHHTHGGETGPATPPPTGVAGSRNPTPPPPGGAGTDAREGRC